MGRKVFGEVFKACNTTKEDRRLLRRLERPPSQEQAGCFVKYIYKNTGHIKEDGTANIEKIAQQFIDYGLPVPDDLYDTANIQIENDLDHFTDKAFPFIIKNKDAIKLAFYGSVKETFE